MMNKKKGRFSGRDGKVVNAGIADLGGTGDGRVDLAVFRLGFFYVGMPLKGSRRIHALEGFGLSPSSIHGTLWKFSRGGGGSGLLLNFADAFEDGIGKSLRHEDGIVFGNGEETFAIAVRDVQRVLKGVDLASLRWETHRWEDESFNHFVRVFFKRTVVLNHCRVFVVEPETVYQGYRHVISGFEGGDANADSPAS